MCGIVGIFYKNSKLRDSLGASLAAMLMQMSERGPDSAGVALYRDPVGSGCLKLSLYCGRAFDWDSFHRQLEAYCGTAIALSRNGTHSLFTVPMEGADPVGWIADQYPEVRIMSAGNAIEIYKQVGAPSDFIRQFALSECSGTHALGHTRMATESAVTTEHSHPFSTGLDLCLVHNGSLSNHNRLRQTLQRQGVEIRTDNDSEVAAGYLMWRLREGDSLETALDKAISDLDGFYTLAIGTGDGFAVLRDPIACKPAVLAETDDWVAMASEFRAIAQLNGVQHATVWEPAPATVYAWSQP